LHELASDIATKYQILTADTPKQADAHKNRIHLLLVQEARSAAQEAGRRAEALRHEAEALREQFGAVETDAAERLER
jgi:hypothetical protein